ncbi:MAG TPA: HAMP domain-containing sensor histidine kinase [Ktedonobacteraceae bacterium]|nr:HAMP domain-containing sensor histidine kinase [Ktedonobacteraceae bacterium]
MEQQSASGTDPVTSRDHETSPEYLHEVLKYVVEIGASLRLQMDTDTLLKRIAATSCKALRFRYAVIYLSDGAGYFRVAASSGINQAEEEYLRHHPLPDKIVARIVDERYRISDSYLLPAEAPIWEDEEFASNFVAVNPSTDVLTPVSLSSFVPAASNQWRLEDLMLVPLIGGNSEMLGFLTPDAPLNGLRPTKETMGLFELFANQAAVVIEGAHLYDELREAVRQARESERVKNNFLMTASHELRTPLTAVQGYLELLGDYSETLDDASRARFIQNARRGCDELVLLLGNLLDATHLDVEKITFKPGPVDLAQSTQLILEILEPIIAREKRAVEVHVFPEPRVWVDELRLRQILLNLLGNALKYTPSGSRIAIHAECIEGEQIQEHLQADAAERRVTDPAASTFVLLAIRDWGPGVALEEQSQLFTRFTRLEAARRSSQRGAGLGLYLCRQLIVAMGGAIWMESSGVPGEGATFFVALPMYSA